VCTRSIPVEAEAGDEQTEKVGVVGLELSLIDRKVGEAEAILAESVHIGTRTERTCALTRLIADPMGALCFVHPSGRRTLNDRGGNCVNLICSLRWRLATGGFRLGFGCVAGSADALREAGTRIPRLNDVREFVCEQSVADACVRVVGARCERDVLVEAESACIQRPSGSGRVRVGVDADVREVGIETLLEIRSRHIGKTLAACR
jgi:hypothetical protein